MNKLIKFAALVIFWGCITFEAKAQDPQFSQFYANQLLLNPAFTGSAEGARLALNYRSQWSAIPGHFKTFAAAFDIPVTFGPTRHGLGLSLMADQAGAGNLTKLDVLFNYAYRVLINDDHAIRFGISAGFQQASIDFFNLRFPNQIDPLRGPNAPLLPSGEQARENRITEDVSLGVVYYNNFMWAGVGLHHLTAPRQQFITNSQNALNTNLPMRITAFTGLMIPFTKDKLSSRSISPSLLFKYQGPFMQLDVGGYVNFDPIVFGLYFRAFEPDAVIGLIGVRKGMFSVGYSYDYTLSSLTNGISGGSHEVSLVIEFEKGITKKRTPKVNMNCPRF
jgi:type IX secretion system PorP/SprF family membrane protein